MSTISNSASLRLFRISCTHVAIAPAFRPGRVLPTMIPIFSIFDSLISGAVPKSICPLAQPLGSFPGLFFAALDPGFLLVESFRCEQPELLKRCVELCHLPFGQH